MALDVAAIMLGVAAYTMHNQSEPDLDEDAEEIYDSEVHLRQSRILFPPGHLFPMKTTHPLILMLIPPGIRRRCLCLHTLTASTKLRPNPSRLTARRVENPILKTSLSWLPTKEIVRALCLVVY
jgi:hypothetical protein